MPNVMVALLNVGGGRPVLNAAVWLAPTARLPCSNAGNRTAQDSEEGILHLAKFRYGATAAETVYIVYQPR